MTYGFGKSVRPYISLEKKLSTILKHIYQLETYLLILPIMIHHFRINLLLITIKHKGRNRGCARIRWNNLSRSSCT